LKVSRHFYIAVTSRHWNKGM